MIDRSQCSPCSGHFLVPIDDEIWCLLVPAFRTGDKANVPTYLPHGFPPANTVEHILQLLQIISVEYFLTKNASEQTHCGGRR